MVLFERNETVCHHPSVDALASLQRWVLRILLPSLTLDAEKNLRVQIPHRVSVARTRIRLLEVPRD